MTKEKVKKVKKCVTTAAVVVGTAGVAIVATKKRHSSGGGKSDYEESGIYGREKRFTVASLDDLLKNSR